MVYKMVIYVYIYIYIYTNIIYIYISRFRLTVFYENFLSSRKVVVLSLVVGRKFP